MICNKMLKQQYQKNIENRMIIPTLQFLQREKSSGIVLALFVALALILTYSPLREEYAQLLEHHFGFVFDGQPFLNFSIEHWFNNGLMSMFFFVMGLELKREFIGDELRDLSKVTLPVAAAVMGMLLSAGIYLLFNLGTPVAHGWEIPMATDIAFALAVLYMLGNRVPISAKVFLTTLAIVDDLGSVVVIALFYTSHISVGNLVVGLSFLLVMFVGNRLGVKNVWFYGLLGIGGVWVAFLMSGIHATISAVLAAMVIPADSRIPEAAFIARMKKLTRQFEQSEPNDVRTLEPEQLEILSRVKADSVQAMPPLQRLEHSLHPLVFFVIMPVFALANTGVSFVDMNIHVLNTNHVAPGVLCGLLLGKRSRSMSWRTVTGVGFLTSIGFTMSMFVTMLAFDNPDNYIQAKVGIFAASIMGGFIGYRLLKKKS